MDSQSVYSHSRVDVFLSWSNSGSFWHYFIWTLCLWRFTIPVHGDALRFSEASVCDGPGQNSMTHHIPRGTFFWEGFPPFEVPPSPQMVKLLLFIFSFSLKRLPLYMVKVFRLQLLQSNSNKINQDLLALFNSLKSNALFKCPHCNSTQPVWQPANSLTSVSAQQVISYFKVNEDTKQTRKIKPSKKIHQRFLPPPRFSLFKWTPAFLTCLPILSFRVSLTLAKESGTWAFYRGPPYLYSQHRWVCLLQSCVPLGCSIRL